MVRFGLTDWHEVKDNGKIMTVKEVIDCLNNQDEQIKELEKQLLNLKEKIGFNNDEKKED